MVFNKELLRGTLELIVLHLISIGDTYGYVDGSGERAE